jgi:hypothetical protein
LLGLERRSAIRATRHYSSVSSSTTRPARNRTGHGRIRRTDCPVKDLQLLQCYLTVADLVIPQRLDAPALGVGGL